MKKVLYILFVLSVALVVASQAFAAGGGGSFTDKEFLFTIVNFVILVVIFKIVLTKPALKFFESRAQNTQRVIEDTKKAYDEAYRHFEEIEAKLKNADVESKELIQSVKEQAESEKHRIMTEAREFAENIKKDAERIADNEVRKAKQLLKQEATKLAAELAVKKVQDDLSADDQVRLGREFLTKVQNVGLS